MDLLLCLTTVFLYKFKSLSISEEEKCVLLVRFSTIFFSCFFIVELALMSDTTDMLVLLICSEGFSIFCSIIPLVLLSVIP